MERVGDTEADAQVAAACLACSSGPRGIAGHEQLFSHTMGSSEMHFVCRSCGSAWARQSADTGAFEWRAIDSPSGADTPGRSGMTPP
jgi:hypothetical protein